MQRAPGLYPIMLRLTGRRCVVIGGGSVALRKVQSLAEAGADDILVVSERIMDELAALQQSGAIRTVNRNFQANDLEGAALVFAATNDHAVNADIGQQCSRLGVWFNAADDGDASSFVTPAVVRSGDLVIALTTGGASPALAAKLKKELAEAYGSEYAPRLQALRLLRHRLLRGRGTADSDSGAAQTSSLLRAAAEDNDGWRAIAELLSDIGCDNESGYDEEAIQSRLDRWIEQLRKQVT